MDLRILPLFQTTNVNKIGSNFATNPIKFKGLQCDTFERQTSTKQNDDLSIREQMKIISQADMRIETAKAELDEIKAETKRLQRQKEPEKNAQRLSCLRQLKDEKQDEIKALITEREMTLARLNPNIAFLSDSSLSWGERREILYAHDEIMPLIDIRRAQEDNCFNSLYYDSPYFVNNKTNIGIFLDTSFAPNVDNYETLSQEGLLSYSEFCAKYGFDLLELNRYVREGLIEPLELTNLTTGEQDRVHILDTKNNQMLDDAISRHDLVKSSGPQKSKYADRDYLPADYLAKLGFGTESEILEAVKYKRIPGVIKTKDTEQGPVKRAYVNMKHPGAEGGLHYLRNQNKNLTSLDGLAKLAKVDVTDIEDALISGEISFIPVYVFKSDSNRLIFSLKSAKNLSYIDKKQFEAEIAAGEIKKQRREKSSLRAKIAWALCPETKKAARSIVAVHPELKDILKKVDEIRFFKKRKEDGEVAPDEKEPFLTNDERIKLKMLYKGMWKKAGTEEYNQAMQKAKTALSQYKTGGLNAVNDEEIREIIRDFYEKKSQSQDGTNQVQ